MEKEMLKKTYVIQPFGLFGISMRVTFWGKLAELMCWMSVIGFMMYIFLNPQLEHNKTEALISIGVFALIGIFLVFVMFKSKIEYVD
jgi:hypothetical protein